MSLWPNSLYGQAQQQNAALQQQQGSAFNYTPPQFRADWDVQVRKIANGYLIECAGKQYQCPDLEHLGEVITAALVEKRITG